MLTNAHVVDMLSPDSTRPDKVVVRIYSGEKDEKILPATILGVDRASDLAVLDVRTTTGLPKPLTVSAAGKLNQLDKVYVFGFPLGDYLGKEMTITESKVSALRRRPQDGVLERVQVNGGMDHGNSGGPVVDRQGHVIGVAVAMTGTGGKICFAIPGERVHTLLYGRIAGFGIGQAFKGPEGITADVKINMIDPRAQIKQVGLDVWVGNAPSAWLRSRPASSSEPTPQPGDALRKYIPLPNYRGGVARGKVTLPPLPNGQVYWVQPRWQRGAGENVWGSALVYQPGEPLERKPVDLKTHFATIVDSRHVLLSVVNKLWVGNDEESEVASVSTQAGFSESITNATDTGASLTLAYQGASHVRSVNKQNDPHPSLEFVRDNLGIMKAQIQLDAAGSFQTNKLVLTELKPGSENLKEFHNAVNAGLEAAILPLANKTVKPGDTWQANRAMSVETMGGNFQRVPLNLTCKYLGARNKAGREEAVVNIQGKIQSGKVHGQMVVDVATGIIRSVELHMTMEVSNIMVRSENGQQTLKLRSMMIVRVERDL